MLADMAADMEVYMVADMEVDKVADMFANIVTKLGVPNLARRRRIPFFLLVAKLGSFSFLPNWVPSSW